MPTKIARKNEPKIKRLSSIFRRRSADPPKRSAKVPEPIPKKPEQVESKEAAPPKAEEEEKKQEEQPAATAPAAEAEAKEEEPTKHEEKSPEAQVVEETPKPEEKADDVASLAVPTLKPAFTNADIADSRPRSPSSTFLGSGSDDDLVVQRLNGWKNIVKNYISYFAAVRDVENSTVKSLKAADEKLAVPIKEDHYFSTLGQGGVQDAVGRLKQLHNLQSQQHQLISQNISSQTIPRLDKLHEEVKNEIKQYRHLVTGLFAELQRNNKRVTAAHESFTRAVSALSRTSRTNDPYLTELALKRILVDRTNVEQALFQQVKARKEHLRDWENGLVDRIHEIINNYLGWKSANTTHFSESISRDQEYLLAFDNDSEWDQFSEKFSKVLADPKGLQERASADDVDYPLKSHESTHILFEGPLERVTRSPIKLHKDSYAVLTKLGYLHVFASPAAISEADTLLTLYIPECYLELPRDNTQFRISGATGSGSIGPFRRNNPLLFGASDETAANQWVTAIRSLGKDPSVPKVKPAGRTGSFRTLSAPASIAGSIRKEKRFFDDDKKEPLAVVEEEEEEVVEEMEKVSEPTPAAPAPVDTEEKKEEKEESVAETKEETAAVDDAPTNTETKDSAVDIAAKVEEKKDESTTVAPVAVATTEDATAVKSQ